MIIGSSTVSFICIVCYPLREVHLFWTLQIKGTMDKKQILLGFSKNKNQVKGLHNQYTHKSIV